MRKKIIALIALLVAFCCLTTACGVNFNYRVTDTNSSNSVVKSNGGMTVIQGDYLYFINGVSTYTVDNTFDNVVKGAIMRYKINNDGSLDESTLETVVPKKVFNSAVNSGFYIFGQYIYYATPTTKKNSKGEVQTDYIEFYRAKTDGSGTTLIKTIKGNSTKFAFSDNALVYLIAKVLYSISLNGNFSETIIAEDVSQAIFPQNMSYDPANTEANPDFCVYYTCGIGVDDAYSYNKTYCATYDNSVNKQIIGRDTFFTQSEIDSYEQGLLTHPETTLDYAKIFMISILSYSDGTLYYTKSFAEESTAQDVGVYSLDMSAYDFDSDTIHYALNSESKLAANRYNKVYVVPTSCGGGILADDGEAIWHITMSGGMIENKTKIIPTSATIYVIKDNGEIYYSTTTANIYIYNIDGSAQRVDVLEATPNVSWLTAEFIDGYIYYVQPDYKYVYRVNTNVAIGAAGREAMIGIMSDEDSANQVAALIALIPEIASITEDNRDTIESARAAYNALTDKQKKLVLTINKLTDAETALAELE